ncbi:MAG: phosphoglucosamine mutase [Candidatus Synoicihabitans palmerolidicus]|nr:phosphoglucosamine mutase [Candidatus Synoicihabitans palmerolidicus]
MKRRYFGTDGVRGPFGGPLINESFAARLTQAAGQWAGGKGRVLIGRDTRASGEALMAAIARGLTAAGLEPVSLGVIPTPAVARAMRAGEAVLGVVITASHNPAADNGIKFFTGSGIKLTDADELAIEAAMPVTAATGTARLTLDPEAVVDYVRFMVTQLPEHALRGWPIVLDVANGATVGTSPAVLRRLGAVVTAIGDEPDGSNINAGVGSEHPEKLAEAVVAQGARIGIAHDGDGDRCILCDETGGVLDGDEVLAILAHHGLRAGELSGGHVVITVQSNLGVDTVVKAGGGTVSRTDVGDRYVSERMREVGASLGGETSGHIICTAVGPTGDGLGAALQVLRIMHRTGEPLSVLRKILQKSPQRSGAIRVAEKLALDSCAALQAEIVHWEATLGDRDRVLVRYSGTEPKLRLLVEGETGALVEAAYARLVTAAAKDLNVE